MAKAFAIFPDGVASRQIYPQMAASSDLSPIILKGVLFLKSHTWIVHVCCVCLVGGKHKSGSVLNITHPVR